MKAFFSPNLRKVLICTHYCVSREAWCGQSACLTEGFALVVTVSVYKLTNKESGGG